MAVWKTDRAFHYSYVDVDSSNQSAAVLLLWNTCTVAPAEDDVWPLFLSTLGTSVDAMNSAWNDLYRMWIFNGFNYSLFLVNIVSASKATTWIAQSLRYSALQMCSLINCWVMRRIRKYVKNSGGKHATAWIILAKDGWAWQENHTSFLKPVLG